MVSPFLFRKITTNIVWRSGQENKGIPCSHPLYIPQWREDNPSWFFWGEANLRHEESGKIDFWDLLKLLSCLPLASNVIFCSSSIQPGQYPTVKFFLLSKEVGLSFYSRGWEFNQERECWDWFMFLLWLAVLSSRCTIEGMQKTVKL